METDSKAIYYALGVVALVIIIGFISLLVHIPAQDIAPIQAINQTEAFYPEPTNYAVDAANALTPGELATLNNLLKNMDTEQHQYAVAIVKTTAPLSIEEYGIKLAEKWKVGYKGLDNGLIVILATEDRKIRLEVGYGLESSINDAKAGRLIDEYMIPSLKNAQWANAISSVLVAINNQIK